MIFLKLFIASDIHGSALYCKELLEAYDREKADRLLLLGDVLYHGPRNDLPDEYSPRAVSCMLNERRNTVLCVRGNCDSEVDQMMLNFPMMAEYAYVSVDRLQLFATHGHVFNPDRLPPLSKEEILLYGHTHVPSWEKREGILCLNPGSVAIPKKGSSRSYMILEDSRFEWKTLDGHIFHSMEMQQ